jgi:hypothetical protein
MPALFTSASIFPYLMRAVPVTWAKLSGLARSTTAVWALPFRVRFQIDQQWAFSAVVAEFLQPEEWAGRCHCGIHGRMGMVELPGARSGWIRRGDLRRALVGLAIPKAALSTAEQTARRTVSRLMAYSAKTMRFQNLFGSLPPQQDCCVRLRVPASEEAKMREHLTIAAGDAPPRRRPISRPGGGGISAGG